MAKGTGPVVSPGVGPRKPSRCSGLGRPHPRPVRQASARSPTPTTVPYPGSPVIPTGPPQNASREKRGAGKQPGSASPGFQRARRRKAGSRPRSTNDWVTLASSLTSPPTPASPAPGLRASLLSNLGNGENPASLAELQGNKERNSLRKLFRCRKARGRNLLVLQGERWRGTQEAALWEVQHDRRRRW